VEGGRGTRVEVLKKRETLPLSCFSERKLGRALQSIPGGYRLKRLQGGQRSQSGLRIPNSRRKRLHPQGGIARWEKLEEQMAKGHSRRGSISFEEKNRGEACPRPRGHASLPGRGASKESPTEHRTWTVRNAFLGRKSRHADAGRRFN